MERIAMEISDVKARERLDLRGKLTVEGEGWLAGGGFGRGPIVSLAVARSAANDLGLHLFKHCGKGSSRSHDEYSQWRQSGRQRSGFVGIGEAEDTAVADLAGGTNSGLIEMRAPARTDRVCKYDQLLRIEEYLGGGADFLGRHALEGC